MKKGNRKIGASFCSVEYLSEKRKFLLLGKKEGSVLFSVEWTWDLISENDEGSAEPTALQSCCHFLAFLTL